VVEINTPMNEQETIIRWYRDESNASIYTSDTTMMRKYDKYVESGDWEFEGVGRCGGDVVSKTYVAPKQLVFGRSKKKKMTDDNKAKVAKALADARERKQSESNL